MPVARKSDVMPFRSVVTAAGGAGSLAATAVDAARWMRAFAGGDVLTPAMQREMLADVARTATLKSRIPYGLGIQSLPIAGRYALGHSGRFLGFRNVVRYLPAEGVTIAVLTNQGVHRPDEDRRAAAQDRAAAAARRRARRPLRRRRRSSRRDSWLPWPALAWTDPV